MFDLTALGFMVGFGGGFWGEHDSVHVRVTFLSEGTTTCLCSFGFMFFWVRCVLLCIMLTCEKGTGLKIVFSILNVPHATARHNVDEIDEMTPVKSFRLSRMAKGQAKVLFRAAAKSKPAAVFSAGKAVAKVVAGDNAAESEFARSKNQLRRIGKLGRMSPKSSHIDVLAVRRLLEKPGFATCIAALARYRKSRAGQLGHAPGHAYDITKDHKWLFD